MPFLAVERNPSVPLQSLLRRAHVVLPFLPEAKAVNYSVDAVVSYVRVYLLSERVKIDGSQGPLPQGLKPASLWGLGGTAEAVPFPDLL
jgi:hypothetical protein